MLLARNKKRKAVGGKNRLDIDMYETQIMLEEREVEEEDGDND
jgi:hypothetical protein